MCLSLLYIVNQHKIINLITPRKFLNNFVQTIFQADAMPVVMVIR
jgi:hypothetical protein